MTIKFSFFDLKTWTHAKPENVKSSIIVYKLIQIPLLIVSKSKAVFCSHFSPLSDLQLSFIDMLVLSFGNEREREREIDKNI